MLKSLLPAMLYLLAASACSFQHGKATSEDVQSSTSAAQGFADVQSQVINVACMQCHDSTQPILSSYANVLAAKEAIKQAVFVTKSMPKSGALTAKQSAILYNWLESGAPEFASQAGTSSTPNPDPTANTKVLWKELQAKVININCAGCHSPHNSQGISDYTDLATFRSSISTIMYVTLVDKKNPMPPLPATLTAEQKKLIANWVIDGELDNEGNPPVAENPTPNNPPVETEISYHLASGKPNDYGINFEIKHFLGSYQGISKQASAKVTAKQSTNFELNAAEITLPLAALSTGNAGRDCHLQEALGLNYSKSKYPQEHVCDDKNQLHDTIEFPSLSLNLENLPIVIPKNESFVDVQVWGKLQIHGVTKEKVSLPIHVEFINGSKQKLKVTSHFPISLKDYGIIVKPGFFGLGVSDQVGISLNLLLNSDQSLVPGAFENKMIPFQLQSANPNETGAKFDIDYFAGTHHGEAKHLDADLEMELGDQFAIKAGKFNVPIASLETGNASRDCHLREALGIDYTHSKFPGDHVCDANDQVPSSGPDSIAYPFVEIEMLDWSALNNQKSLLAGDTISLAIKAKISIHGVKKEGVSIPVQLSYLDQNKGLVQLTANFTLSLKDFGAIVKPVLGSFGTVSDEVRINLDSVFAPK